MQLSSTYQAASQDLLTEARCTCICRWLLASVIVLGLMHGIAFSAAYQMVARFANKNTISLGLGCVGSGLLALALELILSVGPKPTRVSFIILFEVAAGATVRLCWDQHF